MDDFVDDSDRLLTRARQAFEQAAMSPHADDIARHAEKGRDLLHQAHLAAQVTDGVPSFWPTAEAARK